MALGDHRFYGVDVDNPTNHVCKDGCVQYVEWD